MPPTQKTWLTRPVRTAIFLVLLTSFFIISPLLIAYTIGYSYNWQTHRIEQTGVVSVDFEPKDATVSLNGVPMAGVSPMRIPNRHPGNYHIAIAKDGYASWEKDIVVSSKQTTYIKNITLFKNSLPIAIDTTPLDGPITMSASADGAYLALRGVTHGKPVVMLYDTKSKTTSTIEATITASSTIAWSPFSSMLSIMTPTGDDKTVTIVTLSSILPDRIDTYTLGSAASTEWSQSILRPGLYAAEETHVVLLSRGKKTDIGTLPAAEWPWFVDTAERLWWYNATTFQIVPSTSPENSIPVPADNPVTRIVDMNSDRVIVQNGISTQVILLKQKKVGTNAPDTMSMPTFESRYNANTKEWLTWSPWELWSIYDDGHTVLLNRRSERIEQVLPLDKFGVELLTTPASLAAFNPGYYTNHTLWQGGSIESVGVNQKIKQIFFTGTIGAVHGLFALEY